MSSSSPLCPDCGARVVRTKRDLPGMTSRLQRTQVVEEHCAECDWVHTITTP